MKELKALGFRTIRLMIVLRNVDAKVMILHIFIPHENIQMPSSRE